MNRINLSRSCLIQLQLACAVTLCATSVFAKPVVLSEQELSSVNGQGFVVLENIGEPDLLHFSTIALNADVTLNANFHAIKLGSDIDIQSLQFGRSDLGDDKRLVQISNPYLQFAFDGSKVVGLRLGFDGISGDVGFLASTISGSMLVQDPATSRMLDATGSRWNASSIPTGCIDACAAKYLALKDIGSIRAGDSSGPSRDFWISALMSPVQFPVPANSGLSTPPVAQAGYWLNWRDKLVALSSALPPNVKPPGH